MIIKIDTESITDLIMNSGNLFDFSNVILSPKYTQEEKETAKFLKNELEEKILEEINKLTEEEIEQLVAKKISDVLLVDIVHSIPTVESGYVTYPESKENIYI